MLKLFERHIGITGTRNGMTPEQKEQIYTILVETYYDPDIPCYFHHGDCVGADADGHDIAEGVGFQIIIHPPDNKKLRAFKTSDDIKKEKKYLVRNANIVNSSEVMLATPATNKKSRGGTWWTINYAKKQNKPLIIIFPDGSVKKFNHVT